MKPTAFLFAVTLAIAALSWTATAADPGSLATTNTAPAGQLEIAKSVFAVPSSLQEGRNPFFPNSTSAKPVPTPNTPNAPKAPSVDTSVFVLNGITSPPKRTAMINGRTFEPGEEGEIKLPSGSKVLIKCEEIKDNAAVILVGGIRRELRMRFAL